MKFQLVLVLFLTLFIALSIAVPHELAFADGPPTVLTNNQVEVTVNQPICSLDAAGNVNLNTQISVFNNESFSMNFSVHYEVVPAGFTTMKNVSYLASGEYSFTLGPNETHEIPVSSVLQNAEFSKDYALIVYTEYQYNFSVGPVIVNFSTNGIGENSIISQVEIALAVIAAVILVAVLVLYIRHRNKRAPSTRLG